MLDAYLVAEKTVVTAQGDSQVLDISPALNQYLLLTLKVSAAVEQESLEVTIYTSPDGATWDSKPAASFPQCFYCGTYPLLLDLSQAPGMHFLRAHWEVTRWGRGETTPRFEFSLRVRQVPPEMLATGTAKGSA